MNEKVYAKKVNNRDEHLMRINNVADIIGQMNCKKLGVHHIVV
jgi:hypothetical protein